MKRHNILLYYHYALLSVAVCHIHKLLFRIYFKRYGIDAVAFSGGWRAVVKHMPKMRATACADDFLTAHAVTVILFNANIKRRYGVPEAWPARAGLKFIPISEQIRPAANTLINAFSGSWDRALFAKSLLGPFLPGYFILFRC